MLLDNGETSRIIWLHGTAGVGKSAVAFTVAERMKALKVSEKITEKRLAGSFFFSRKHMKRCTTGYFFATLVSQFASNFASVREDVNRAICDNPTLLDPDKSLHDQMETLFLQPLLKLRFRLRDRSPSVFVIDALDECTSETELAYLISLLGQALSNPDIPVIHILLTSRSEIHIHEAIQEEGVRPLVCEIPVKTSGKGVAINISLDGADVDKDICIFLEHSFRKLQSRSPNFPQPTKDDLTWLAARAGRRFIVASTMMKFIDDGYNDPRERLQLILDLRSELLPGTEVYKFYDSILSTCPDPKRAYVLLSCVAALADPLPISDISNLLGPVHGRDVGGVFAQLRSVLDIPTDNSLPVNIYHSSVRDYVSDPSNCSLPQVQDVPSPQSLLTQSSFPLMKQDIPESTVLPDVLPVWKSGVTSLHTHDARPSMNMYPVQDLGPAVDESYEFASSLRPLMEYTEGDKVNLRGICDFLSSTSSQSVSLPQRGGYMNAPSYPSLPHQDRPPGHPGLYLYQNSGHLQTSVTTTTAENSYPYQSFGHLQAPVTSPPETPYHHQSSGHPQTPSENGHHSYTCLWLLGDNTLCRFQGALNVFWLHFSIYHLPSNQNAQVECRWEGCDIVRALRCDTVWRHVRKAHLSVGRRIRLGSRTTERASQESTGSAPDSLRDLSERIEVISACVAASGGFGDIWRCSLVNSRGIGQVSPACSNPCHVVLNMM